MQSDVNTVIKRVGVLKAKKDTDVGRVYLPREWIGKEVKCTLIESDDKIA